MPYPYGGGADCRDNQLKSSSYDQKVGDSFKNDCDNNLVKCDDGDDDDDDDDDDDNPIHFNCNLQGEIWVALHVTI